MTKEMWGADPDALDRLADACDAVAERLVAIQKSVGSAVHSASWAGADGRRFVQDWDGPHRQRVSSASGSLHQAARTLRHEADQQRGASAAEGGMLGGGVGVLAPIIALGRAGQEALDAALGRAVHGVEGAVEHTWDALTGRDPHRSPESPSPSKVPSPSVGHGTSSPPAPAPGYGSAFQGGEAEFKAAWREGSNPGYDQWNFGYQPGENTGDCTSFVAWRLNQLAHDTGHPGYVFNNNTWQSPDGTVHHGQLGNAKTWVENSGLAPSPTPTVGSVAVWGADEGHGSFGHVAVVKEILPNGNVVMEESAWEGQVYQVKTYTSAQLPQNFLSFLPTR